MDNASHIGIRITIREFEYLKRGLINAISRQKNKYWINTLLEPKLDKNKNLIWEPKKEKLLIAYTNNKKDTQKQKYEISKIVDNKNMIVVKIKNKIPENEEITIEIFGEKYRNCNEILEKNDITQITKLLEDINS